MLAGGVITTALTIRPLGAIRVIRQYVTVLVVLAALVVLVIGLLRRASGTGHADRSWAGFWLGVDSVVAVSMSWVPLGADYSRHSRAGRAAFRAASSATASPRSPVYAVGLIGVAAGCWTTRTACSTSICHLPLGTIAWSCW